ncbi:MAG: hypothetical protein ACOCWG_04845 [bacterium]
MRLLINILLISIFYINSFGQNQIGFYQKQEKLNNKELKFMQQYRLNIFLIEETDTLKQKIDKDTTFFYIDTTKKNSFFLFEIKYKNKVYTTKISIKELNSLCVSTTKPNNLLSIIYFKRKKNKLQVSFYGGYMGFTLYASKE